MANVRSIRRSIRRVRQKGDVEDPLPESREGFDVPDNYKSLDNGQNFLLFDSGSNDADRILIFGTDQTLDVLAEAEDLFQDGTFKIVPESEMQNKTYPSK